MLKPITNWKTLQYALAARQAKLFFCDDCGHVWFVAIGVRPKRCPNSFCRALADSPKRDRPGKPVS